LKAVENSDNAFTFAPATFTAHDWSLKQWNILDGLKVNGAGHGYFEYEVTVPESLDMASYEKGTLLVELVFQAIEWKGQRKGKGSKY
jgi:hypothetical protein